MSDVLIQKGVAKEAILREDKSMNPFENACKCHQVTD